MINMYQSCTSKGNLYNFFFFSFFLIFFRVEWGLAWEWDGGGQALSAQRKRCSWFSE